MEERRVVAGDDRTLRREILDWVRFIVIAFAVILAVRTFVCNLVRVDGVSMRDTLYTDELMFVERVSYRFGAPQSGDVVICRFAGMKDDFVKRIVGVPGDTIEIRAGVVYRNGAPVDEPYVVHPKAYEDRAPETLGADEYLAFGDNRADSTDGRVLGPLRRAQIKGRVLSVVWPPSEIHGVS